jgi:protein NrfC
MKNKLMKNIPMDKLKDEGIETLLSKERRQFLKFGLAVTGVFLGGSILSLTSATQSAGFNNRWAGAGKRIPL